MLDRHLFYPRPVVEARAAARRIVSANRPRIFRLGDADRPSRRQANGR